MATAGPQGMNTEGGRCFEPESIFQSRLSLLQKVCIWARWLRSHVPAEACPNARMLHLQLGTPSKEYYHINRELERTKERKAAWHPSWENKRQDVHVGGPGRGVLLSFQTVWGKECRRLPCFLATEWAAL